jgi:hypothetical protein
MLSTNTCAATTLKGTKNNVKRKEKYKGHSTKSEGRRSTTAEGMFFPLKEATSRFRLRK